MKNTNSRTRPVPSKIFTSPITDAKLSPLLGSTTAPKAQVCTCNDYMVVDSGSSTTDQFFATRHKIRLQGGRWKWIAPVYVGAYVSTSHTSFGTPITAPYTCSFVVELSNGTTTTAYDSLNTGGTYAIKQGTFNGNVDAIVRPNDIVVGDRIFASDFGLAAFSFTDRSLLPWVRTAYSKTSATDNLGCLAITEYNAPYNGWYATCANYANAKTRINAVPVSINGGGDFWGTGDTTLPGPMFWIGEGMDGQISFLFVGTSILDGDGNMSSYVNGGVNPANNSMRNYDLLGWPCAYLQDLANQVPGLNLAVGGSAMGSLWSDTAADYAWTTTTPLSWERLLLSKIAQWVDVVIINDVHNDGGISAAYADVCKNLSNIMRAANPAVKMFGCRVPNGYVDIAGATQAYTASLDARWTAQDNLASAGYIEGMLNIRTDLVTKIYPDLGTQVSSTTTSLGTLTTLNDSGAQWIPGQWVNSWVSVGGVSKLISSNTRTQLTFAALAGAVLSGTAYLILGNTTADGTHPNSLCQKSNLSPNFKTQIGQYVTVPYFTRTA